jgi:tol-pal system protein YbgF
MAALAVQLAASTDSALADGSTLPRLAQLSAPDLVLRIDRLEEEIRRLTGLVEQLQYRNQQLEQQLRRAQAGSGPPAQADTQARWREPDPGMPAAQMPPPANAGVPPTAATVESPATSASGAAPAPRRDVFDPNLNPNAPGAPRTLGTLAEPPAGLPPARAAGAPGAEPPDIGAPGGRAAGAPLDLSSLSGSAARELPPAGGPMAPPPSAGPATSPVSPPAPRNPSVAAVPTMAPSATPKDEYDLAYGYVLHKDYALAEESFRAFLKKYPGDRLVADANYWLGEALFQRQRYREAAESFLTVSTKYETAGKAPDALLRLGQSLAALGERDAACATYNEVARKYPRASVALKQGVEREQKRAAC